MRRQADRRIVLLLAMIVVVTVLVVWRRGYDSQGGKGFVLTLEYTGQLVAGLRGLQSQQCWISSFGLPLVIVEPFLSNSTLRINSNQDPWSQNSMHFRDIFDLNHFNGKSNASGLPVLVSREHLLTSAPRKVIVVTFDSVYSHGCLHFTEKTCTSSDSAEESSFAPCNIPTHTQWVLRSLQQQNFGVVRSVCFSCLDDSVKSSPSAITKQILGPYDARDVTIVINKWKFSFTLSSDCKKTCTELQFQSYIESPRVVRDTRWYAQTYFPTEKFVAVALRMEWYLISQKEEGDIAHSAVKCLSEVTEAVERYQIQLGGSSNVSPFLTMDIGTYGSTTFKDTLRHTNTSESLYNKTLSVTKDFVKELYGGSWTFKDWEESFLRVPGVAGEKAYIGAVQRSIASRGECLILMGGGHFQHMILEAYIALHPDRTKRCIKFICMARPFLRMFTGIISST